jgi:hypothetical protein
MGEKFNRHLSAISFFANTPRTPERVSDTLKRKLSRRDILAWLLGGNRRLCASSRV